MDDKKDGNMHNRSIFREVKNEYLDNNCTIIDMSVVSDTIRINSAKFYTLYVLNLFISAHVSFYTNMDKNILWMKDRQGYRLEYKEKNFSYLFIPTYYLNKFKYKGDNELQYAVEDSNSPLSNRLKVARYKRDYSSNPKERERKEINLKRFNKMRNNVILFNEVKK
jgi:hypothetical protein